jgi:Flp pilus assembly protein TadG
VTGFIVKRSFTLRTRITYIFGSGRLDESGVALVEFALVLPVLLLMLVGMVDFGKVYNYWIDETHLANEGARYAVVNKNPSTSSPPESLQAYIKAQIASNELRTGGTSSVPTSAQVCVEFPNGTSNLGDPVKVTVSADYHFIPFVAGKTGVTTKSVTGSSIMRLEAPPTKYAAGCV